MIAPSLQAGRSWGFLSPHRSPRYYCDRCRVLLCHDGNTYRAHEVHAAPGRWGRWRHLRICEQCTGAALLLLLPSFRLERIANPHTCTP